MTGTLASAASIARLNALYKYIVSSDVPYDAIRILLWSQIEVNVAIVSASSPSLRPLLHRVFKSSTYTRSYGRARPHRYGYGYGESNYRRTFTHGHSHEDRNAGAVELRSRDGELAGRAAEDGLENSSQEHILEPNTNTNTNPNIMKTVVIEMKSEER